MCKAGRKVILEQHLPYWIQLLQALSTPAIGLTAIIIGVKQWRTAHQRAALDLFDRRWAAYEEIRSVIGEIVREGNVTAQTTLSFAGAINRAAFLFGPEVISQLESWPSAGFMLPVGNCKPTKSARGGELSSQIRKPTP
jgi:hypothetical protein